ncbi:MAG: hypothetical protein KF708_20750 [Pirellulales bacterium]|nr:hypothetical protein [Pirellulales bacterium]
MEKRQESLAAPSDGTQGPIRGTLPSGPGPTAACSPLRWLYVHNPFYAISAALVFAGLRASFDTTGASFETGLLLASLAAYTVLLAATALLIVRWGQVWEDARSLLLLVVIGLLAMSVTFDDVLARNPRLGFAYNLLGWIFAIVVSEALLHGLRIRLSLLYRLPYYMLLSLFFFYPPLLVTWLADPNSRSLEFGLFGFAPAMSLAFLLLLPAVRRGAAAVRENGTPWPWPWFPWTLFGVLGFCACVRAYYLCVSLHFVPGNQLIFGPWFLVPLLLALTILVLEGAIVSRRKGLEYLAYALPVLAVAIAFYPLRPDTLAGIFYHDAATRLHGTPAFWTLAAATALYAYAALRGGGFATTALTGSLLAWSLIGPSTSDLESLTVPQGWPLLLAATVQAFQGYRQRDALHWLAFAALVTLGLSLEFSDSSLARYGIFVPLNLALALVLVLAGLVRGPARKPLYGAAAVLALASCWSALSQSPLLIGDLPAWLANTIPLVVAVLALAFGQLVRERVWTVAGGLAAASCLLVFGARAYDNARYEIVGLDRILLGLTFFLLAAGISVWKARWAREP